MGFDTSEVNLFIFWLNCVCGSVCVFQAIEYVVIEVEKDKSPCNDGQYVASICILITKIMETNGR